MRRLTRLLLFFFALATGAASLWTLSQNPFAKPLIARSELAARAALTRAVSQQATTEWLTQHVEEALAARDADALELYIGLANDLGKPLPPALLNRALEFARQENAFLTRARQCAACAIDLASCKRLAQVAACAVPIEISPIGDLNALRRAGFDWASGQSVDRLDVGLALVGLGASAAAIGSAGTSLPVKAGATFLRLAHRLGALTPKLARTLTRTSQGAVHWSRLPDYAFGRVSLSALTDGAKLAELASIATDLGRIRAATSTTDALALMRRIDTAQDARRMARLAEIEGPRTRRTLAALGKSRAFRLLLRISDLALLASGLLAALAMQIASLAGAWMRRMVRPARR